MFCELKCKMDVGFGLGDFCQAISLLKLYEKKGYTVAVDYPDQIAPLFEMAGIKRATGLVPVHAWRYYDQFNDPTLPECLSNKAASQINCLPFPWLGNDKQALWEEMIALEPELKVPEEAIAAAQASVGARPLALVHTAGTSFSTCKNLDEDEACRLYDHLISQGFDVIELDRDWRRGQQYSRPEYRNLCRDFRRKDLSFICGLMTVAKMIVAVDSGMMHLSRFFPKLDRVFFQKEMHMKCVCIPSANLRMTDSVYVMPLSRP